MRERDVRAVLPGIRILQQPTAEALELTRTVFAWQEDAMTLEAFGSTKGKVDRTCRPGLDTAEQCGLGDALDLVFPADRDVGSDQCGLDWIKVAPQSVQAPAPGR
jgi:hypothetical protein